MLMKWAEKNSQRGRRRTKPNFKETWIIVSNGRGQN